MLMGSVCIKYQVFIIFRLVRVCDTITHIVGKYNNMSFTEPPLPSPPRKRVTEDHFLHGQEKATRAQFCFKSGGGRNFKEKIQYQIPVTQPFCYICSYV